MDPQEVASGDPMDFDLEEMLKTSFKTCGVLRIQLLRFVVVEGF